MTGYPSIDKPWLKYFSEEAISTPIPECTMYEFLYQSNKDQFDDVALIYYGKKITYRTMFSEIDKAARAFTQKGISEGDVVAVISVTFPEIIYAIYALNKIGAVSNLIDPRTPVERLKIYMERSKTKMIVAVDKFMPRVVQLQKEGFKGEVVSVSAKDSLPLGIKLLYSLKNHEKPATGTPWKSFVSEKQSTNIPAVPYKKNRAAAIVFTGGTTGTPKGAELTDDTMNIIALQYKLLGAEYNRKQNFLNIMPPFIAYGITCGIHMPLVLGLNDVLIPVFDPDKFDDMIIKYKPAHLLGVPTFFEKLSRSPKMEGFDLSFLESAGVGGDTITIESEKMLNKFLHDHGCKYDIAKGYGLTEVGSAAVACHGTINKLGSIGVPHCKTIVSIFKPGTEKELSYNQEGEIYISTPAIMLQYTGDKEETDKILAKHSDGTVWVHSNDIGYMDEDGFIFLKGRMKRMIVRPDGHNVWPSQIEAVILQHPAVDLCAVVGLPAPTMNGKIPTAFIVLKKDYTPSDELLKGIEAYSKQYMPERDTASEFRFIDKLPMTSIGKVDFRALEEQAIQ